MRQFLKRFESILDRALGFFGGVVCAVAASLAALYACTVFRFHLVWFIGAAVFSLLFFSVLGLLLHRYFACFFIPVFAAFANPDGHAHCDDGHSRKGWIAGISLFVALIALFVGALFQIHISFAVGVVLFCGYSLFAPRVFLERGSV